MKNIDVTPQVMQKVVVFERKRARRFLRAFWVVTVVLGGLLSLFLWRAWQIIAERGTLDMLSLFVEDREIIAEFWQDTLAVVFQELPQKTLMFAFTIFVFIAIFWIITRQRRQVMRRRLETLAKKRKKIDT